MREMVNFELGKEIKKDVFRLVTSMRQKKNSESQKHYTIDIADPSSMQNTCHTNFKIDLAHRRVPVTQW